MPLVAGYRSGPSMQAGTEVQAVADAIEDDLPPLDVTLTDPRRGARTDYQNARLIALLRGPEAVAVPKELLVDDLAPARALIAGVSIGAAMWAAIIVAIWYFM